MRTLKLLGFLTILIVVGSCQKYGDVNPNVPGPNSPVPPSLLLNRIENELAEGPGIVDGQPGSVTELPSRSGNIEHYAQYLWPNNVYYGGIGSYDWSYTAHPYNMLKDIIQMENIATSIANSKINVYTAISKFLRAYIFVWYSQRVGDCPMTQAGQGLTNPTPAYNIQHDVYQACLAWLDTANTYINTIVADNGVAEGVTALPFKGDIFGFTGGTNGITGLKQWQKVINSYRLRVLISLSNKASLPSAADLNIAAQFNTIVTTPAIYPLMGSNADNLIYRYSASFNPYAMNNKDFYDSSDPLSSTLLSLTDSTGDPRTYVFATPSIYERNTLKRSVSDFRCYLGVSTDSTLSYLLSNKPDLSYINYNRYFTATSTGPATGGEALGSIIIGYPEMCFNIAEGVVRGWTSASTAITNLDNGINASMSYYGVTDMGTQGIYDVTGDSLLGTVTYKLDSFLTLTNTAFTAASSNPNLEIQLIINQKYIAMWMNSGWEPFYNWRRTGYPTSFNATSAPNLFTETGKIPQRWQYPSTEVQYNTANWQAAIKSQYGGTDDLYQPVWINNGN